MRFNIVARSEEGISVLLHLVRFMLAALLWAAPGVLCIVLVRRRQQGKNQEALGRGTAFAAAVFVVAAASGVIYARDLDHSDVEILGRTNGVLEADIVRVVDTLTNLGRGNYRTKVHPLQCLMMTPFTVAILKFGGLSPLRATQLTTILSQAGAVCLLAVTLWRLTTCWWATALATMLALSSFAFIFHSTIPESAGLAAVTVILPYYFYAQFARRRMVPAERSLHVAAAVLALGVTVTNVIHSAFAYGLRLADQELASRPRVRQMQLFATHVMIVAVALSLAQLLLYPGSNLWFLPSSVREEVAYLRADALLPTHWASTYVQMFGYTIVGPRFVLTDRQARAGLLCPQISAEAANPVTFPMPTQLSLVGVLALTSYAFVSARRSQPAVTVALALLSNFALHLVYGTDYLLYGGNWTVPLCLLIGLALVDRPKLQVATVILLAVMLPNNLAAYGQLMNLIKSNGYQRSLHMPISIPESGERSRVFVDHTGGISPGIGSYGIHLFVWDPETQSTSLSNLITGKAGSSSLLGGWLPIVVTDSSAGDVSMRQTVSVGPSGQATITVSLRSAEGSDHTRWAVYVIVSPAGPASSLSPRVCRYDEALRSVTLDSAPFLLCSTPPTNVSESGSWACWSAAMAGRELAEKLSTGRISHLVRALKRSLGMRAQSQQAESVFRPDAVMLRYEMIVAPGCTTELSFRAVLAPATAAGPAAEILSTGHGQPPSVAASMSTLHTEDKHEQTIGYWRNSLAGVEIDTPDPQWRDVFLAAAAQLAMLVEEGGKPIVSPVNYDVFVRDAVYAVNGLLLSGQFELAARAIDYLLQHPWAGRPYAEGDSPGQLLWVMGQYWAFTHDQEWLAERAEIAYELASALARMRTRGTTVAVDLLGHRTAVHPTVALPDLRRIFEGSDLPWINYGAMDQNGVLYVNLFSMAGLGAAVNMLDVAGMRPAAERVRAWQAEYAGEFARLLRALDSNWAWDGRGHCAVLWPCRYDAAAVDLAVFSQERARDWSQGESTWLYLDIDSAHNAMLAGQRTAGYRTLARYFRMPSVRTYRTLDEGGPSSEGYWSELRANPPWPRTRAMPHSWSLASLLSLLRDCLVAERSGTCMLLAGIPDRWFDPGTRLAYRLPTEYGTLALSVEALDDRLKITVDGDAAPPDGFALVLPGGFETAEYCVRATGAKQSHDVFRRR